MKSITDSIAKIVATSGLTPLHPYGYPRCALMIDYEVVVELNEELRKIIPAWREDDWCIGEDGAGNYFMVSQSNSYSGVKFWDHETNEIRNGFDTVGAFVADALRIESENQTRPNTTAQTTASPSSGL